jgi:hypothetical protein
LPGPWSPAAWNLSENQGVATEKAVRALALALPETIEKPCYGTPGFYVRTRLFARLLPDATVLAVRVEPDERDALLQVAPGVFFVTPHYESSPMVLIRLPKIARAELQERLVEAWRFVAPARLLREFDASH